MRRWLSRFRLALALLGPLTTIAIPLPAIAQTSGETATLDALFARLRMAPNEAAARVIADQIWLYWTTPSDPVLAARMGEVLKLRQRADFPGVLALLDEIIADYPSYAEAWNQRATVFYLLRNFDRSIADIEKVLALEPRHFGALVGRAVMRRERGENDLALKDMIAALAIHPFLVERAMFPELEGLISI